MKERTGLAKSTIYKMIAKGIFPKPIQISSKAVGWLESDIQGWIEDKVGAARRAHRNNN